jgi:hypothetical protein
VPNSDDQRERRRWNFSYQPDCIGSRCPMESVDESCSSVDLSRTPMGVVDGKGRLALAWLNGGAIWACASGVANEALGTSKELADIHC